MADLVLGEHSGDFLRLARLWQKRSHHSWLFAAVNAPHYRDELIARLNALTPAVLVRIAAQQRPSDWLAALTAARISGAQRAHVVLVDGWLPDSAWWQEANVLRERLADAFPHPVVLWLPDACITDAARHAPDLWNWREAIFSFDVGAPPAPAHLQTAEFSAETGTDKLAVLARLQDIESYLSTNGAESAAAAQLLLEAASAHERLGNWTQAQNNAQQAFEAFSAQNNERMAAQAKGQIADIFQARGRLDEALLIRQNDELPVYQQLGDVRSVAITQGKIADIFQARGRLDEALILWRDEALPVFLKVGYIAEAEFAKKRIAALEKLIRR